MTRSDSVHNNTVFKTSLGLREKFGNFRPFSCFRVSADASKTG